MSLARWALLPLLPSTRRASRLSQRGEKRVGERRAVLFVAAPVSQQRDAPLPVRSSREGEGERQAQTNSALTFHILNTCFIYSMDWWSGNRTKMWTDRQIVEALDMG